MYCLDTYALIEIARGNPKFTFLINEDFVISNLTLAEFYWVLIRDAGQDEADYWINKLSDFSADVSLNILLKAQRFRYLNRKKDISFFDSAGYIFSKENKYIFVTGDKEFKDLSDVKFITK